MIDYRWNLHYNATLTLVKNVHSLFENAQHTLYFQDETNEEEKKTVSTIHQLLIKKTF
jgi:hypothetical protein